MARIVYRLNSTGHPTGFTPDYNTHFNKVRRNWAWSTTMDAVVDTVISRPYCIRFIQSIYRVLLNLIFHIYIFFLQKWDWKVGERINLLEWLEDVTNKKFYDLKDVWLNGGKAISLLIQERTNGISLIEVTNTIFSAQHLAMTQLGVPRVFNNKELLEETLNKLLEKKLINFLKSIKNAINQLETATFYSHKISEYIIARGIGLCAAYVNRRALFSIYSRNKEGLLEGVVVEMKGNRQSALLVIGGEHINGDIVLEYKTKKEKVLVSYILKEVGHYHLKISQNGFHVPGSPFEVYVERAPLGYNGMFGASEWFEPDIKKIPNISGVVDINGEKVTLTNITDVNPITQYQSSRSKYIDRIGPESTALPLRLPFHSSKIEKSVNDYKEINKTVRFANTVSTLLYTRKFTTKLRSPFNINLENFHYFDNINALPSTSKTKSDIVVNKENSKLQQYDRFKLTPSSAKVQTTDISWLTDNVDKKDLHEFVQPEQFNVWPSITVFGPPQKLNFTANKISCNTSSTSPPPYSPPPVPSTTTTTYISPDGAAFPISLKRNENIFDNNAFFKTTPETSLDSYQIKKHKYLNKTDDTGLLKSYSNVVSNEDSNPSKDLLLTVNSTTKNRSPINEALNHNDPLQESSMNSGENHLSSSIADKSEESSRLESSSSDDCYRMPSKERIIEVALKAEYECTVFIPKAPDKEDDKVNRIQCIENGHPEYLAKYNEIAMKRKDTNELKKFSVNSKRRCKSLISALDTKSNNLKERYNLRRTKSAFSSLNIKPISSAINYIKNRKKVFIRIGEYAKGSSDVIKSSKSVKKWKHYWDSLQYEKNVYSLEKKNCTPELNGIVAKGKHLFENISNKSSTNVEDLYKAVLGSVVEEENIKEVKSIDQDKSIAGVEDPERKERFKNAKNIFTTLENRSGRIYRSLPNKEVKHYHIDVISQQFKEADSESFTLRRSLSERFHVTDLYRDIQHEGLGAPGIPHRLAVLASLRSVEPRVEEIEVPGYSTYYPHLPTTPQNKYIHRSNMETLIPWNQIVKINT